MLRVARPWVHAARGACLLGTTILIVLSLQRLPMAQTYAVTFSTPLLATASPSCFSARASL
jgi:drug/metabolite transporter (DMT)-like permease